MTVAQTQTLELFILFGGAAFAALAGVAFLRAGLDRSPTGGLPAGPLRGLWTPFLRPAGATSALLGLVGIVLTIVPSPLGPRPQLFASLFTGGIVALLVAFLGVVVDVRLGERSEWPPDLTLPERERRVALLAGVALTAGSASAASLAWVGLYLFNVAGIPSLSCVALGASLVWASFALLPRAGAALPREKGGSAVPAAERGVGLYTLFLAAPSASALSAFVPSVVRSLQPNAVLFPMAAELVLLAVGLLALAALPLYRAGGGGTDLHLPLLASASFATVACLGLDAAFLGQSPSLLLALVIGPWLLFGTVEVVAAARRRTSLAALGGGGGGSSYLESALTGGLLVVGLTAAYVAANWTTSRGVGVLNADLGGYGVTLFVVAMVGSASTFLPLETRSVRPPTQGRARPDGPLLAGITEARRVVAAGVALVLSAASFALVPYLLGLAPTEAASRLAPVGLLPAIGFLLGVALVYAVVTASRTGMRTSARDDLRRFVVPLALAIAAPGVVAQVLGATGLFYLVLGTLATSFVVGRAPSVPSESARTERAAGLGGLLPMVVATAAAVIGALFLAHSWLGAL